MDTFIQNLRWSCGTHVTPALGKWRLGEQEFEASVNNMKLSQKAEQKKMYIVSISVSHSEEQWRGHGETVMLLALVACREGDTSHKAQCLLPPCPQFSAHFLPLFPNVGRHLVRGKGDPGALQESEGLAAARNAR